REAIAQTGGVQGQGQARRWPTFQGPFQQGCEAGGDIELPTLDARLGLLGLVELLEARPDGGEVPAQDGNQGIDDTVEATSPGHDQAEAVEGQDDRLGPTEVPGEGGDDLVAPGVDWMAARHGGALRNQGCWFHTGFPREPHASPKDCPPFQLRKTPPSEPGEREGRGGGRVRPKRCRGRCGESSADPNPAPLRND